MTPPHLSEDQLTHIVDKALFLLVPTALVMGPLILTKDRVQQRREEEKYDRETR